MKSRIGLSAALLCSALISLLIHASCGKEVTSYATPRFKVQEGVGIPQSGGTVQVPFTFDSEEGTVPAPFRYRLILGREVAVESRWEGGSDRMLVFEVPRNNLPEDRGIAVMVSVGDGQGNYSGWSTVFSGLQSGKQVVVPGPDPLATSWSSPYRGPGHDPGDHAGSLLSVLH